ncbi:MAG: hypothetical protein N2544_00545 [Burkholderiales bacterium]|nr:hypothetical protein [Burkholderiales bacterium]
MSTMNTRDSAGGADRALAATVFASLGVATAAVIAFSGRGFDVSDEGFYLLTSQFPEDIRASPNLAHYYTRVLYLLAGGSVPGMRLAGLMVLAASAAMFAAGCARALAALRPAADPWPARAVWLAFITLGALLYYTWVPYTPSYNLVNSAALNTAAGLGLWALAAYMNRDRTRAAGLAAAAAGFAVGVAFFAKFPTGISAFAGTVVLLLAWPGLATRVRVRAACLFAAGAAGAALMHFTVFQSPREWHEVVANGIELVRILGAGHDAGALRRYAGELLGLATSVARAFWPGALLMLAAAAVSRVSDAPRSRAVVAGLAAAAVAYVALRGAAEGWVLGGQHTIGRTFALYCGWVAALTAALLARGHQPSRQEWHGLGLLLLTLAALPMVGAVGTSNTLPGNAILAMAPWFALLVLLASEARRRVAPWVGTASLAFLCVTAAAQVVSAQIVSPYRLSTGILGQIVPTTIGMPASTIGLDPATSEFFRSMRAIAERAGFRPGDDVLAFVRMPGVVFALGGRSPGIPWYTSWYPGSRAHNEFGLSLAPRERVKKALIVETSGGKDGFPDLSRFDLRFPEGYTLCGELVWPVTGESVRLWRPGPGDCAGEPGKAPG